MWLVVLNCVIVGIVIAIGTFASFSAEMMILSDENSKRQRNTGIQNY